MAKFTLDITPEVDYSLAGIYTHERDYRLCWGLNRVMEWQLERKNDFLSSEETKFTGYSFFIYENFENDFFISIIKNKGELIPLIPEKSTVDFLLLVKGHSRDEMDSYIRKIKTIPFVVAVEKINTENLKKNTTSKLIF